MSRPIRKLIGAIFRRTKAKLLQRAAMRIGEISRATFDDVVAWVKEAEAWERSASNDEKRAFVREKMVGLLGVVMQEALYSVIIALAVSYMKLGKEGSGDAWEV